MDCTKCEFGKAESGNLAYMTSGVIGLHSCQLQVFYEGKDPWNKKEIRLQTVKELITRIMEADSLH